MRPKILCWISMLAGAVAPSFSQVQEARPVDGLIQRLPDDCIAVLAANRLADQFDRLDGSHFWKRAQALPGAREWDDSDEARQLRAGIKSLETLLPEPFEKVVRSVLGNAVTLSIHPEPGVEGGFAGLVLLQADDPALLKLLVRQFERVGPGGVAWSLERKQHNRLDYTLRRRPGSGRPADAFALLPDGRLAWSNSERVVTQVLDKAAAPSESHLPGWIVANRGLFPPRPIVELHVAGPAAREALAKVAETLRGNPDIPFLADLEWAAASLDSLAVALAIGDQATLRAVQRFSTAPPNGSLTGLIVDAPVPGPLAPPPNAPSTLLQVAASFDGARLSDLVLRLAHAAAPDRLRLIDLILNGVLNQPDAARSLLSRMGPVARLLVEYGDEQGNEAWLKHGLAFTVAVQFEQKADTANQLIRLTQVFLALISLDEKADSSRRLEIDGPGSEPVFHYTATHESITARIGREWFLVGSSDANVRAIASWLERLPAQTSAAGSQPNRLEAVVYAAPVRAWLDRDRDSWIHENSQANAVSQEQASRDFDRALDVLTLLHSVKFGLAVPERGRVFIEQIDLVPASP